MSAPPTIYTRLYNFVTFQTGNPTTPLPAVQVDGELNAIKVTLDSLISRLAQIQRSDGALGNAIVTIDSLAQDALTLAAGLNRRGAWITATAYALKDVVSINGASYQCIVAHTSGVFATDLAANKWAILSSPGIAADGSSTVTADIPFAAHKLTGVAAGVSGTDATNLTQATALAAAAQAAAIASANAHSDAADTATVTSSLQKTGGTMVGQITLPGGGGASQALTATEIAALIAAAVPNAPRAPVSVRQTVLSGPVDANGLPNFGGATGSTTVTAAGTIVATAANGEDIGGGIDRVGSIVNPSWTTLSTNGTMFLFLDIAANGVCTPGSTTLAPVYQFGGAYSNTANQFTFNVQEMVGKVGSGAANAQAYRVFVGEVTVAAGVVSAITWYALKGRYVSAFTATLPGASTAVVFSHNIGTKEIHGPRLFEIECTTPDNGYAVGDRRTEILGEDNSGAHAAVTPVITSRLAAQISTQTTNIFLVQAKGGGTAVNAVVGSWKYRMIVNRGW